MCHLGVYCNCLWWQGSWGQHGVYLVPTGPRWAPYGPREPCYLGTSWFLLAICSAIRRFSAVIKHTAYFAFGLIINFDEPYHYVDDIVHDDLSLHCNNHIISLVRGISKNTLQWRHNGRDGVSNHQSRDYLLNLLFRRKKKSKLRVTGSLCREFTGGRWIPRTKGQ